MDAIISKIKVIQIKLIQFNAPHNVLYYGTNTICDKLKNGPGLRSYYFIKELLLNKDVECLLRCCLGGGSRCLFYEWCSILWNILEKGEVVNIDISVG